MLSCLIIKSVPHPKTNYSMLKKFDFFDCIMFILLRNFTHAHTQKLLDTRNLAIISIKFD